MICEKIAKLFHKSDDPADIDEQVFYRDSAVIPSEKSSINANRKSTTRFPISLR